MKSITISAGITLTATETTIATYLREKRDMEARARAIAYLRTASPSDECYSDIYKDVYGVRPRWFF